MQMSRWMMFELAASGLSVGTGCLFSGGLQLSEIDRRGVCWFHPQRRYISPFFRLLQRGENVTTPSEDKDGFLEKIFYEVQQRV